MSLVELSSSQCWDFLQQNKGNSFLIDVRSKEEWLETGVADLSSINNEARLISWLLFTPHTHQNDNFITDLNMSIQDKDAHLFFICKSGGRSAQAANATIKDGYKNCYNVNDGFVGNMFNNNLKETNLNGWMNSNLPRKKL
jgi:rhodanese-related sulfurtransferase